eukprot:CAMPEP_0114163170 /NCGR_PEP_ID=MMETSP0043_2-20121206/29940_1 /TAXON_ID=464988 /ORGANISM="Hemiselmis andersenii, Strain CCMP644" /LENGTH=64 /DNA_ID=CAMNT_0001259643 /DNA_START=72 /DNA_END=263 /DNA_ORIENTATION=-
MPHAIMAARHEGASRHSHKIRGREWACRGSGGGGEGAGLTRIRGALGIRGKAQFANRIAHLVSA